MTKQPKADRHPYQPTDEPVQGQHHGNQQPEGQQPMGQQQASQQPQYTIPQLKKQCCEKLTKIMTSALMNERLMRMAGGDASRVAKNLTSFLSIITQDEGSGKGNDKKYFFQCSVNSLTACFLESMNMQLPFDSRQLVCMVIYAYPHGLEAELDISYKGFVNALNRHYRDAFVECKLVFEADEFTADIQDRVAKYHFKPADPFAVVQADFKGIKGGYCFFSYTDTDGKTTSRLVFLSIAQIRKNKERAKQQYVWNSDPKAMAEKTCIREGSKLPFAAIDLDMDIEEVANRHYMLESPDKGDKLKQLMAAQEEIVHGKSDEPKHNEVPAADAAGNGAEKPAPEDGGKDAKKETAVVDDEAGRGVTGAAPADGNEQSSVVISPAGSNARRSDDAGGISDAPKNADIHEAEFEEVKP